MCGIYRPLKKVAPPPEVSIAQAQKILEAAEAARIAAAAPDVEARTSAAIEHSADAVGK